MVCCQIDPFLTDLQTSSLYLFRLLAFYMLCFGELQEHLFKRRVVNRKIFQFFFQFKLFKLRKRPTKLKLGMRNLNIHIKHKR